MRALWTRQGTEVDSVAMRVVVYPCLSNVGGGLWMALESNDLFVVGYEDLVRFGQLCESRSLLRYDAFVVFLDVLGLDESALHSQNLQI